MPISRKLFLALLFSILAIPALHAQAEEASAGPRFTWPETPSSPHEPVTGPLQVLSSPRDRAWAAELLDRAGQNYRFYVAHGTPFTMRVSFVASGQSQFGGNGSMEETWLDDGHKTWTAELAGNTSGRSVYLGHRWPVGGSLVIPLRVQMVRSALFWPVAGTRPREDLRMQKVNFQGSPLTCILTAGNLKFPPAGRHWVETEYCVDEQTGLLHLWSAAPGYYTVYDYTQSVSWNGHQIASTITFYENSMQVLQIHVENVANATANPESFRPPPEFASQPPAPGNGGPVHFAVIVAPKGQRPTSGQITPIIVHAAIAADGSLLDAEVVTPVDAAFAQRALAEVKARCRCFIAPNEQTEALINVEFFSDQ